MKSAFFYITLLFYFSSLTSFSQTKDNLQIRTSSVQNHFIEFKKDKLDSLNIDFEKIQNIVNKLNSKESINVLSKITKSPEYKQYIIKYIKDNPKQQNSFGSYIVGLTHENRYPILTHFVEDLFKLYRELMPNKRDYTSPIKSIEVCVNLSNSNKNFYYAGYGSENKSYPNFEFDRYTSSFQYKENFIQLSFLNNFKIITIPIILNKKHIGFVVLFYEK